MLYLHLNTKIIDINCSYKRDIKSFVHLYFYNVPFRTQKRIYSDPLGKKINKKVPKKKKREGEKKIETIHYNFS